MTVDRSGADDGRGSRADRKGEYQCLCAEGMPERCPCNTVPFTPDPPDTHLFILTAREARVIARALQLTATMADALGNDTADLDELRDRFAPDGLEASS